MENDLGDVEKLCDLATEAAAILEKHSVTQPTLGSATDYFHLASSLKTVAWRIRQRLAEDQSSIH